MNGPVPTRPAVARSSNGTASVLGSDDAQPDVATACRNGAFGWLNVTVTVCVVDDGRCLVAGEEGEHPGRLGAGGDDVVEVGLHDLGRQRRAVGERDVVAEVERELGGVVVDLPRLGQPRHQSRRSPDPARRASRRAGARRTSWSLPLPPPCGLRLNGSLPTANVSVPPVCTASAGSVDGAASVLSGSLAGGADVASAPSSAIVADADGSVADGSALLLSSSPPQAANASVPPAESSETPVTTRRRGGGVWCSRVLLGGWFHAGSRVGRRGVGIAASNSSV